jgi:hypothetical protein
VPALGDSRETNVGRNQRGRRVRHNLTSQCYDYANLETTNPLNANPRYKVPFQVSSISTKRPVVCVKGGNEEEVRAKIRAIFTAPDLVTAQEQLRLAIKGYKETAPKLSYWLQQAIPEGWTVFSLPEQQRRLLRTSNGLERVKKSYAAASV